MKKIINLAHMVQVKVKRDIHTGLLLRALQKKTMLKNLHVHDQYISFQMDRKYIPLLRRIRRKYPTKIKLTRADYDLFFKKDIFSFVSIVLFICLPIILNSFVWDVQIEEATPELKHSIQEILKEENVQTGMWIKKFSETAIRQAILAKHHELSWVFITLQGSDVTIKVQYAPKRIVVRENVVKGHLVAKKEGIITHAVIERGERQVHEHDTVKPGDLLVSGVVEFGQTKHYIGAKGEVFADYWQEVNFEIPREVKLHVVDGESWLVSGISVSKAVAAFTKKAPFNINVEHIVHSKEKAYVLNEKNISTLIMPLLERKTLQQLAPNSKIKSQKLLHLSFDNDTVKGKLLFLINENIAQIQPFIQGD